MTTPQDLLTLFSAKAAFSLTLWPNFHNTLIPLFVGPPFVGPLLADFSNNKHPIKYRLVALPSVCTYLPSTI